MHIFLSRYSLQGDTKKYFSIGKYSGELKTVQALDREENSTYTMEVLAVDGSKTSVTISTQPFRIESTGPACAVSGARRHPRTVDWTRVIDNAMSVDNSS